MKKAAMNKRILCLVLLCSVLSVVLFSCKDDDEENPIPDSYDYFVDQDLQTEMSQAAIDVRLKLAALAYPDIEEFEDDVKSGIKVYKITYKTTFEGESIKASGVVAIPDADGEYPVLSFQNGTNVLHSAAPSVDDDSQLFLILKMMASTGFVVVIPDYLGFGESEDMFHPYMHEESTVQSIVDMLKAVREFADYQDGLSLNNDLYIDGYSQGGWATMQVQKYIEENSVGSYSLKASACGGGPYDIKALNSYVLSQENYPQPYFLAYVVSSYEQLGLTTDISQVFQEPYASLVPDMFDGTKGGSELNGMLTTIVADLFTSEYIEGWNTNSDYSDVVEMMEENSVGSFVPTTPTKLFHGNSDTYIPQSITDDMYNSFVAGGASDVSNVELDGDHTGVVVDFGLASLKWFLEISDAD